MKTSDRQVFYRAACLCVVVASAGGHIAGRELRAGSESASDAGDSRAADKPKSHNEECQTTAQKDGLTIRCRYGQSAPADGDERYGAIALRTFNVKFNPKNLGPMNVELTFANEGRQLLQRDVFLTIDDEEGTNCLRRELHEVSLESIASGSAMTFSQTILSGAYKPGHQYTFSLWIPGSDPALKFDPRHNLLLRGVGVADSESGLNRLAVFAVTR